MSTISKKICLFGDFGVGKTSLIRQFVESKFSDEYLSTVGVKISRKMLNMSQKSVHNLEELQLLIWDIEGSNKFKAVAKNYFQGSKGAVLVGDVTQPETLNHLREHIETFLAVNPQSYIVVALNKSDMIAAEYLESIRKMYQFSNEANILDTYITSAKTGNNVNEIFQTLATHLI
ncbi:small GTP-binding protein [Nostoc linckia z18]|uniref:Small GTP-binding protein n=2 Tax=Nostoc linckia TaxID=92942 RepID=A0A9Q5Z9M7_NOSLI|nr:Rab family GTPase [Nostoc linckia]PHK28858.1 small GTP-binding protein [Nostoc linckia z15]PHK44341.1 small GTP-binding protein [Nostoc linckia z16]PHJ61198.1 small GTP-binding protein [Nostoc linckia z3]PHJ65282.1 small GTP-binding protein [Nostoc linckia z1]PHJ75250.1 small GTP-binding protein [Nostoc linckia z2]